MCKKGHVGVTAGQLSMTQPFFEHTLIGSLLWASTVLDVKDRAVRSRACAFRGFCFTGEDKTSNNKDILIKALYYRVWSMQFRKQGARSVSQGKRMLFLMWRVRWGPSKVGCHLVTRGMCWLRLCFQFHIQGSGAEHLGRFKIESGSGHSGTHL